MQCFICVTYMIILCSGNPAKIRDVDNRLEKKSFVNTFIASLFNKPMPEEINDNEENKITNNYEQYAYDNYQLRLNEADFLPRRNDRIAMPPLQYRFPKSIKNMTKENKLVETKEDIVINDTNKLEETEILKKERSRYSHRNKTNHSEYIQDIPEFMPFSTSITGQGQKGDRESQTVIKPTVIVNIHGSINNREDTKLDKARDIANDTDITHNVFNINQEINLNSEVSHGKKAIVLEQVARNNDLNSKTDEEIISIISQPINWKKTEDKEQKLDVMQILLTV